MPDARYPHYQSFLLRFWQESAQTPWRVSLHSVDDGKTIAFGDLESLLLFLLHRADQITDSSLPFSINDSIPTGDTP